MQVTNTGTYDIFDAMYPEYKCRKKVRLIEFFGGIGSQAKALERLGVEFEPWKLVEIDKYAVESYNAIHGTGFMPSDITQLHGEDLSATSPDAFDYILTWSFPCQSLSVSGLRKGMSEGSGTTSSLIWEVRRILAEMNQLRLGNPDEYCLPKILLMENVPQVIDAKNVKDLNKMRDFLESLGYSNHLAILKGNDYGVPQARHRAFMVSILGDETNKVYSYAFPQPCGCKWAMQDCLTGSFDAKRYVRNSVAHAVCEENADFNRNAVQRLNSIKLCGRLNGHQAGGVFDPCGVSPTLTAGGASGVNVLWREKTDLMDSRDWENFVRLSNGPDVDVDYIEDPESAVDYFFNVEESQPDYEKQADYLWEPVVRGGVEYSIRTLVPQESFLIMDFDASDAERAGAVTSPHQLHKQAGNSIVVNCIVALLGQFFEGKEKVYLDIAETAPSQRVRFSAVQNGEQPDIIKKDGSYLS